MPLSENSALVAYRNNESTPRTAIGQNIPSGQVLAGKNIDSRVKAVVSARLATDFAATASTATQPEAAQLNMNKERVVYEKFDFSIPAHDKIRKISAISFVVLQEWEGFIEGFDDSMVYTRLKNVRSSLDYETHLAEIPLEEFEHMDRARMRKGSIFRWTIGLQKRGSTSSRVSRIVLRHLPAWTKKEILEATRIGQSLSERLKQAQHGDPSPAAARD